MIHLLSVAVAASFDGAEPFQEVIPFQDVNSAGPQFNQVLTFGHPVQLKAIRLRMKNPQSQFFGINLVQLLGGGFPIIRIQSGITSPHQDLCLQSDEQGDIVLDGCLTSAAAADERALWQFTERVLKENIVQEGGQVVAGDCNKEFNYEDGRSIW
ncbi:F5/8 type C domain-containing protein, putative [Eimeria mitis]|uniref:F5/8 type C domain-containing protein, putative n=1 Tax=Eimeria mitis TaxID=44415 RepID=U6KC83_9EIME|nr:F5/8 type C domain-containing protein, putative [Eimeria mitis]CDJ35564.1 F5/8 type C domain-containing protein, putative [Eimeria mitis]